MEKETHEMQRPEKKNLMSVKVKQFIPFDVKRVSEKSTLSTARIKFVAMLRNGKGKGKTTKDSKVRV